MYPRVLQRDSAGREVAWLCTSCGKPFTLGWGSECNACITAERRHKELLAVIARQTEPVPAHEKE
jgi:hypothetical protein